MIYYGLVVEGWSFFNI